MIEMDIRGHEIVPVKVGAYGQVYRYEVPDRGTGIPPFTLKPLAPYLENHPCHFERREKSVFALHSNSRFLNR